MPSKIIDIVGPPGEQGLRLIGEIYDKPAMESGITEQQILLLAIYFLPTIIAAVKQRLNTGAILAVNLLLGWTIIGWFWAFIWALTYAPRPARLRSEWP